LQTYDNSSVIVKFDALLELIKKVESWEGYLKILKTDVERRKKMGLYREEEPLEVPNHYLETAMDYINTFFAEIIKQRAKFKQQNEVCEKNERR